MQWTDNFISNHANCTIERSFAIIARYDSLCVQRVCKFYLLDTISGNVKLEDFIVRNYNYSITRIPISETAVPASGADWVGRCVQTPAGRAGPRARGRAAAAVCGALRLSNGTSVRLRRGRHSAHLRYPVRAGSCVVPRKYLLRHNESRGVLRNNEEKENVILSS